jgi:nicotinamidase-related amidase
MTSIVDLCAYVQGTGGRLLVMVDLQVRTYAELAGDPACDIVRALENCMSVIRHARSIGMPIAFTRHNAAKGLIDGIGRLEHSAWIAGFEPKRSDMVFERQQPSCYANRLFEDIVSQTGSFAIAGLSAEEACLATAIDAAHRGHHVTFLSDASVSRGRLGADARAAHVATTKTMELFADVRATRHWRIATSQRTSKGHRYG